MDNNYWNQFISTGDIKDYISYKESVKDVTDANNDNGSGNTGSEDW